MTRTITRLFDTYADAENAVRALEARGVSHDDISIVANKSDGTTGTAGHDHNGAHDVNDHGDVSRGVSTGAVVGGAGGLLAGLGMLAIPGLGPIVAAGWLLSTAAGAGIGALGGGATGGIVGALRHAGHTEEDANVYSEGVRRGSTLLTARIPDDMADEAVTLLQQHNGVDAATRGQDYRSTGWTRFDENAGPYTSGSTSTDSTTGSMQNRM